MAMPEMSGDRLARAILKIRPAMPIILCTGHSELMDAGRAADLGIMAFRNKPLDRRNLAETVRSVLDRAGG